LRKGTFSKAKSRSLKKLAGNTDGAFERDEIRSQLQKKKAALEEIEIKLRAPLLSCEDITSQRLAELLAHNGEQLASVSADAGEIVNVLLGRYNKLDRTDDSVYVKAFTGDYCKVDRKSSDPCCCNRRAFQRCGLHSPTNSIHCLRRGA
jgi:hypothetical protein